METKYKVGDKVKVKSLDWYNSNKDENDEICDGDINFNEFMSENCGKEFEVSYIYPAVGGYLLEGTQWMWANWMFEDKPDINTNKQQILDQIERVQIELDKLRALCNN